jgi:hypothetical protein
VVLEGDWMNDALKDSKEIMKSASSVAPAIITTTTTPPTTARMTTTQVPADVFEPADKTWAGGLKQGKGKMTYANGDVYVGEFINNKRQGIGKMTYKNGAVYEGNWMDDNRQGKGQYTWADGDVFEGDWMYDKKTGKGKYTYANGDVYEGVWVDGVVDWQSWRCMGNIVVGRKCSISMSMVEKDWATFQPVAKTRGDRFCAPCYTSGFLPDDM